MPWVSEPERLSVLRAWGLTEPVLRLARHDLPHPAFWYRCQPAFKPYRGAPPPCGPPAVPLWECGGTITAARMEVETRAFVQHDAEEGTARFVAASEQGLLAHLFVALYEDEADDLEGAAKSVGFAHLPRLLTEWSRPPVRSSNHARRLADLIATIDISQDVQNEPNLARWGRPTPSTRASARPDSAPAPRALFREERGRSASGRR